MVATDRIELSTLRLSESDSESVCRDRQLVTTVPEIGESCGCDLVHDVSEHLVGRRESHLSFNLYFQGDVLASNVVRVHDHVVQWPTFGGALQLHAIYGGARKGAWLGAREEREKVRGADLRFEMTPRRPGGCGADSTGTPVISVAQEPGSAWRERWVIFTDSPHVARPASPR